MKTVLRNITIAATGLIVLSGCNTTPVKQVTADKAGYMTTQFSSQLLSPSISKKLPADATGVASARITLKVETDIETSDGKKETTKSVITLVNIGNGLVQRMAEVSNNDIPYSLYYSLTYKGIFDLRWQNVPLRGEISGPVFEVKDIVKMVALPSTIGKDFMVEYSSGNSVQIANLTSSTKTCKAVRALAASELHAKLQGQAIEFECEQSSNGAIQRRSKTVLLQQYGTTIEIEGTLASRKGISRIVDVLI